MRLQRRHETFQMIRTLGVFGLADLNILCTGLPTKNASLTTTVGTVALVSTHVLTECVPSMTVYYIKTSTTVYTFGKD